MCISTDLIFVIRNIYFHSRYKVKSGKENGISKMTEYIILSIYSVVWSASITVILHQSTDKSAFMGAVGSKQEIVTWNI